METTADAGSERQPPTYIDIQHHADPAALGQRLQEWLGERVGAGSALRLDGFDGNSANGMSSDTVLFDATWPDDGRERTERFVARIAPDAGDVPVFPRYDLAAQFETMRVVGEASTVPVPRVWWCEPEGSVLGRPFFVMSRVDGEVPPDMMPYTFGDNWLHAGSDEDRSRLQAAMVDVLARLHAIDDAPGRFAVLEPGTTGDTALARHLAHSRAWYEWSVADNGVRSGLVEAALARLEATLPADAGPTVLSWGDSRIGNVMFRSFEPVAVLDWEMAGLGPPELDVTWLTYSHRVFQDLAAMLDMPGLPSFLRIEDVVGAYERAGGHAVADLDWHLLYAAVRWACAFLRTGARQAHIGGTPLDPDGDALLHNRPSLEQLLAGTFQP